MMSRKPLGYSDHNSNRKLFKKVDNLFLTTELEKWLKGTSLPAEIK